jgi:tryptophanyl-tRNA synthetase
MSKSLGNDLPVFASEKEIYAQVMSITTDPARIRPTDPGDPAKNICFSYLRLLGKTEDEVQEMENRYRSGTIGDVEIKKHVYELFLTVMKPFRQRKSELLQDLGSVEKIRTEGCERARAVARKELARIKEAVGLK